MRSRVDIATDAEIIKAYECNNDYTNMARSLGYGKNINNNVRIKIKNRLLKLDLELYPEPVRISECTKEELFNKRSHWHNARGAIQTHARLTYNNSEKPKCCKVCGYDKHYEVAHLKAVKDFEKDAKVLDINHIDNLIALCPNHHWEFDNGLLNLK